MSLMVLVLGWVFDIVLTAIMTLPFWLVPLLFIRAVRKEMKNGKAFKQVLKEDIFVRSENEALLTSHQNPATRLSICGSHNVQHINSQPTPSASSWMTDIGYRHMSGNIYHNR